MARFLFSSFVLALCTDAVLDAFDVAAAQALHLAAQFEITDS